MLEDDETRGKRPPRPGESMSHQVPFLQRDMLSYGKEASLELIVKSNSTTGVTLKVYGGTKHSLINAKHKTASDGSLVTTTQNIDDFPIFLSIDDPSLANVQGDTFVSVSLRINKDISLALVSGFVYELKPLTYPNNTMRDVIPNRGEIGIVQSADPATETQVSLTVPSNEIWLVMYALIRLVTGADAGARQLFLIFTPATGGRLAMWSTETQAADKTRDYTFTQIGQVPTVLVPTDIEVNLPAALWLEPSTVITTEITTTQDNDNLSALTIMREKFYTGT